jgi:hypothetical protein
MNTNGVPPWAVKHAAPTEEDEPITATVEAARIPEMAKREKEDAFMAPKVLKVADYCKRCRSR